MADIGHEQRFESRSHDKSTWRIVLAIGLPPLIPFLLQAWALGSFDQYLVVPPTTLLLPGSAIIGVGWAIGSFLAWWYHRRAGHFLVWLAVSAIAGSIAGDPWSEAATVPGIVLASLCGAAVGGTSWVLLRFLPQAEETWRQIDPAAPVPARSRWWSILRPVLAIGIPPIIPYLAVLAVAEPLAAHVFVEPHDVVELSYVPYRIAVIAWVVGGLMLWRSLDRRWRAGSWILVFAAIGVAVSFATRFAPSGDRTLMALGAGAAGAFVVWALLRATRQFHGRDAGRPLPWIVTGASIAFAGMFTDIGLPALLFLPIWSFVVAGLLSGIVTGALMWAMLRWLP